MCQMLILLCASASCGLDSARWYDERVLLFFFSLLWFRVWWRPFGQAAVQSSHQANQAAVAAVPFDPVMPKDANGMMQLASRVNGLAGMDKPWHLKANYQTFDADGKPKDQG